MADSKLDVVLRLQGARKFQRDAGKSAGAVDKFGKSGDRASRNLKRTGKEADRTRGKLRGIGTAAKIGMVGLAGMALVAGKNAVKGTQDLTKTTLGLQRATKLDGQEAVRWAAQAKVRGIDAKALNMAMGTLSKNMTLAGEGGKSQQKAFERLGISQKQLKATGGDLGKLLPIMADEFHRMGPSAERTASMMALMGRGWQTLTPLMADGSGFMREQLMMADKYGVTLGDKPVKSQLELFQLQRETAMAQLGWQVQFSTRIAPRLVKAFGTVLRISQSMRGVLRWTDDHPKITKVALGLLAASLAAKKLGSAFSPVTKGLGILSRTNAGQAMKQRLVGAAKSLWTGMRPGVRTAGQNTTMTMGRYGTQAGKATGANIATTTGSTVVASSRSGRIAGAMGRAGRIAGKAFGVAAVIAIGLELNDWIRGKVGKLTDPPDADKGTPRSLIVPGTKGGTTLDFAKDLFGFQHGGALRAGRSALVGEAGPEILTARPGGGFVTPLKQLAMPDLRTTTRDGDRTTIVPVSIDGKEVARVVAKHTADSKARR